MKTPPIYCWREPIDALYFAVVARCYMISRRCIYGLSVFALVENTRENSWQWRTIGEQRFRHVLAAQHNGRLPFVDTIGRANLYGLG